MIVSDEPRMGWESWNVERNMKFMMKIESNWNMYFNNYLL